MKRGIQKAVPIFLGILLISLSFASALEVGFITKTNPNPQILQIFNSYGFDVEVIKDEDVLSKNLASYDFLFIDDGNLRNTRNLPIWNYPVIVMNRWHGEGFGLTDADGISQLGSTSPLEVKYGSQVLQVYTQAKAGAVSIPYYYLDDENKANVDGVARTYTGPNVPTFGDVVATAEAGTHLINGKTSQGRMCFYGIAKTQYWTSNARMLFDECISYVTNVCTQDSDCDDGNPNNIDICENPGTPNAQCVHKDVECFQESDCGNDGPIGGEFCFDGDVSQEFIDYTCNNPGTAESFCSDETVIETVQQCDLGCENGQCLDPVCNQNSDCGTDGFVGEEFCSAGDVSKEFLTYTCNNPGTLSSFCSQNSSNVVTEQCDFACQNGECFVPECVQDSDCDDNNVLTLDECLNPGTVNAECVNVPINCGQNSDCGFTGFTGSEFCSNNGVSKNFQNATCNNPGTSNSFCTVNVNPIEIQECEFACTDGSCIRCDTNSDCDDGNSGTTDTCVLPGTTQSYCENKQFACTQNSDCGTDGFTGEFECSLNNVTREFVTYTCNNPNTAQAFCSSNKEDLVLEQCEELCIAGSCAEITCNTNADCEDGNNFTQDTCHLPGTVNSFCSHGPITCFEDEDCGADIFVGDAVCLEKNVTRNFLENNCENPGTTSSFCSVTISQQNLQQCEFACSDGTCIRCNTNSQCDDGNNNTVDICENPGTQQSFCSHDDIVCSQESDCGTDGFTGAPFCVGDDLYQDFRDFSCNNPGTAGAFCSNSKSTNLIQECAFGCANGACLPGEHDVKLTKNSEYINGIRIEQNGTLLLSNDALSCSDPYQVKVEIENVGDFNETVTFDSELKNGSNVIDTWNPTNANLEPGEDTTRSTTTQFNFSGLNGKFNLTFEAFIPFDVTPENNIAQREIQVICEIGNVTCFQNSDCGTDGFVGGEFCIEDDVGREFLTYTCNNPGTLSSFCSQNSSNVVTEQCEDTCSNGVCVPSEPVCGNGELEVGEQCDDGNTNNGDGCSSICELEACLQQCKADLDLVLDRSGSMDDKINGSTKLNLAKDSSRNFLDKFINESAVEQDNLMGLTIFNKKTTNRESLTNDNGDLDDAIDGIKADGATNFNESIRMGVDKVKSQGRNSVPDYILFLSDGVPTVAYSTEVDSGFSMDENDFNSAIEAANYAASNNVKVMTIGFGKPEDINQTLMEDIASITGGNAYFANSKNSLDQAYNDILTEVCSCQI